MTERIILHLQPGSTGGEALLAARMLAKDGHDQCVYLIWGKHIFARKNKASIAAYEEPSE